MQATIINNNITYITNNNRYKDFINLFSMYELCNLNQII